MCAQSGTGKQEERSLQGEPGQRLLSFSQSTQTCPAPCHFQPEFGEENEQDHVGEGGTNAVVAWHK